MSVKPAMHINMPDDVSWSIRDCREGGFVVTEICGGLQLYVSRDAWVPLARALREIAEALENLPEARAELEAAD